LKKAEKDDEATELEEAIKKWEETQSKVLESDNSLIDLIG